MKPRLECIDSGSEYCPCYLAETGDCMTCSLLQKEEFCYCNWRGICIYSEYVMNGNKRKEERKNQNVKIVDVKKINENSLVIKLKTSKTLARQLKEPGAYVFLRGKDLPNYFDTPMSVMDIDENEGYIYIAYQVLGTKTQKLRLSNENVILRGPYWNGLYGMKNLKKTANKNCLVVARGIAQAPAILVLRKLVKNNNNVIFLVDKGTVENVFVEDIIKDLDIKIIKEDVNSEKGRKSIKNILENENIDLVYSGGSDVLHKAIIDIIDSIKIDPHIVVTNNNEICCGEGVCGGCTIRLSDGVRVKTCKTQVEARKVIERRVHDD